MLAEIFGMDGVVVLVVVLAVMMFGGSQIPKLARSLGSAQREFKQGMEEGRTSTEHGERAEGANPERPAS